MTIVEQQNRVLSSFYQRQKEAQQGDPNSKEISYNSPPTNIHDWGARDPYDPLGDDNLDSLGYDDLISNPTGVLLYGPPGCGKTMLISAVARTLSGSARFLLVQPSTLLRKYVGETNLLLRSLFSLAQKIQPCVLVLDEMDGLFHHVDNDDGSNNPGGGAASVSRELRTEFLQLWDGITSSGSNNSIMVMGATNRPFHLDAACLRRMPRCLFVGLPQFQDRCHILRAQLRTVPLASDFDIEALAAATEGFSASDLKELLRRAAHYPLQERRQQHLQQQQQQVHYIEIDTAKTQHQQKPTTQPPFQISAPPLRPLRMSDVMMARQRTSPTPYSTGYRRALELFRRQRMELVDGGDFGFPSTAAKESQATTPQHWGQPKNKDEACEDQDDEDEDSDDEDDDEDDEDL